MYFNFYFASVKRNWLLFAAMILLMIIIAYRAYVMPITHDEVGTWFHYLPKNLFACICNPECWWNANNHWLNSLLMQWTGYLFGEKVWAYRIPNILAGWLYLLAAAMISMRYLKTQGQQLAGFLFLSAHVYLLDFFSLARGYGMMAAGVIWGIYGMIRYIEQYQSKWLVVAIASLFLAILSNFTALLPWASIGCCWLLWLIIHRKNHLIIKHGVYWMGCAVLLLMLLYFPIKTLAANNEFKWGAENVLATGHDLVTNLLYNKKYLGEKSFEYFLWIIIGLNLLIGGLAFVVRKKEISQPAMLVFLMIVMNVFLIMVNQAVTGAHTPVGRKTIYLIPFLFGLITLGVGYLGTRISGVIAGYVISALLIWNIAGTIHIRSNREWYYDAYYPKLFSVILPDGEASDSIRLSSTWIFYPALLFYQKTVPLPIGGLPFQSSFSVDSTMDYYYLDPRDTAVMSGRGFVIDTMIGPFYLYRNTKMERRVSR